MSHTRSKILTLFCCGTASDYEPIVDSSRPPTASVNTIGEKHGYTTTTTLAVEDLDMRADSAIKALVHGDDLPLKSINLKLATSAVHTNSWTSVFAESALNHLIEALNSGNPLGDLLHEIYERVRAFALQTFQFAKDHPVLVAVIALGILFLIAPWVVSALGFTEEGVLAGEYLICCR